MRPLIAVTSGEPAGIGPELCLHLAGYAGEAHPVVLGDRNLLEARAAALGLNIAFFDFCPKKAGDRSISPGGQQSLELERSVSILVRVPIF